MLPPAVAASGLLAGCPSLALITTPSPQLQEGTWSGGSKPCYCSGRVWGQLGRSSSLLSSSLGIWSCFHQLLVSPAEFCFEVGFFCISALKTRSVL